MDVESRTNNAPAISGGKHVSQSGNAQVHGRIVPVSIVILTFNEEGNLPDCLRSCAGCDDIHVLDSGSTDRTVEIARSLGATVHINPFESFGQQRNWAIDHIQHKYDWVFHLDADERFTPELLREMKDVLESNPSVAGYYVPHKLMFMGRWLRRAEGGAPVFQMRLFHRQRMRFQDWGHGQREQTRGRIGTLKRSYLHYNFSKGFNDWITKHNRYSSLEAAQRLESRGRTFGDRRSAALGSRVERRRFVKNWLLPRLPATWFLRFFWMYILNGGILDGIPGFHYCLLMSNYELWIALKTEELSLERTEHVPQPPSELAVAAKDALSTSATPS